MDLLPPEDNAAERAFIATIASDVTSHNEEFQHLVLDANPDHFIDPLCQHVLRATKALVGAGQEINPLTIKDVLAGGGTLDRVGGYTAILGLLGEDYVRKPDVLLDKIERLAMNRNLMKIGEKIMLEASGPLADPAEIVARHTDAMQALTGGAEMTECVSLADAVMRAINGDPIADKSHQPNLIRFGIPTIDDGLLARAGSLGVIAAKSSCGKSTAACQAVNRSPGSLLASFEMETEEVSTVMISNQARLQRYDVDRGTNQAAGYAADLTQIIDRKIICDWRNFSYHHVEAKLNFYIKRHNILAWFVDYLQLLEPPKEGGANMAYRIGLMSTGFKRLAKQTHTAGCILSQFNREVNDGQRPSMENLRDSGQIEQDANWILFLWTEKKEYQPDEIREVNWCLEKNRGGKRWVKCLTDFDAARSYFIEKERHTDSSVSNGGFKL